jgi:hypothetical protein
MDGFQFIIESPQQSRGQRKRPRLVTSCDNWYTSAIPYRGATALTTFVPQSRQEDKVLPENPGR